MPEVEDCRGGRNPSAERVLVVLVLSGCGWDDPLTGGEGIASRA